MPSWNGSLTLRPVFARLPATCWACGWLWFNRKPPESSVPVSLTLATDLILIGLWLFYTGGYTNPLVSVLLLPIAVAIILVPTRQSIALTLTGIAVYMSLRPSRPLRTVKLIAIAILSSALTGRRANRQLPD